MAQNWAVLVEYVLRFIVEHDSFAGITLPLI